MDTSDDTINYFTCTLGQAQTCGRKRPEGHTVNDFLDKQSNEAPLLPAVAFPQPQDSGKWAARILSK